MYQKQKCFCGLGISEEFTVDSHGDHIAAFGRFTEHLLIFVDQRS